MDYDIREVSHGNARGFYCTIQRDTQTSVVSFATPKAFTGLIGTTFDTKQDSSAFYADNREHIRLQGLKTTEGSITLYQIPLDFLTSHLGKKILPSKVLVDTGSYLPFVFGYVVSVTDEYGGESEELHVLTNVQASPPKVESATDEDKVKPKEFEVPCTASASNLVTDSEGKAVTEIVLRKADDPAMFEQAFADITAFFAAALDKSVG